MITGQSGTVTLLFTDLVNSTEHLQRAGDESGQRLFQAHHKLINDAITSTGGEELEWLGDGALAVFSSSADAVRCAISIEQTARRPVAGARLEIRIGIHLGEVLKRDGGYFGTPVVVARRLCDEAESGQILCSRIIADLLAARQTFNFRDLGQMALKGVAAPMQVCEALYERNDPAAVLNRTPFVGRAEQLQRLSAKLQQACNGQGSIVMLCGEPGIGKTRTLEEFSDLAKQHGAVTIRGACYDAEWQAPYSPFAEAIMEYARLDSAELAALLGKRAPILARIAPGLHGLMGDIPEPVALDKEEERFRLFDAVTQFLVVASQRAPLVLILDDLHWADRGAVAMLSHVAHLVGANSILLIGAYRDAEVDRKHQLAGAVASISRLPNFEKLTLKGLEGKEVADLLGLVGEDKAPDALVKALGEATDGNPLFIREVLLHLVEEGKILREGQGWTSKFSIDELGIPEGVRQVVRRRLQKLSADANRLLSVASAFNGAFSFEVAAAAAGLEEKAALSAIDEALDAQLLRPGSNSESFDFSHAMIRHTLYNELNPARRVRLHRKIAEEMERSWGERTADHAAEVAFQFWRGAAAASSGAERGATYAIAAADNAEAAYDHHEVAAFLRIALDLIGENDPKRPRLLARLSFALTWALNGEEALKVALEAGERIAPAEGSPSAAEFHERIARAMFGAGITRGAWQLAKKGLRHVQSRHDITWASLTEIDINRAEGEDPSNPGILRDSPETHELCEVLRTLPREQLTARNIDPIHFSRKEILEDPSPRARGLWRGGNLRLTLSLYRQDATECERRGAIVKAMAAWAGVARCQIALGDFVEGQAAIDRAAAMSTGQPSFGSMTLAGARTEFHLAMNENWDQLLPDIRREFGQSNAAMGVMEFLKAQGPEVLELAGARACVACIYAFIGERESALRELNELPAALEYGAGWTFTYVSTALFAARTVWELNSAAHAEVIERNIRKKVLTPDFRWPSGDSRLALAHLCALQGRYDEAVGWFAKAREVLDEQGARPLRAMVDYDEALMYLRRGAPGDRERTRPLLATASQHFQTLGMTGWLRSAEQSALAMVPAK
ncbi:MAG: ATP-binding protein [Candidatus Binataceae bacterium]